MKDEKLIKYLSELAASAHRQVTDEEIDALLAAEPENSSEKDENAWPRFVETVLSNFHSKPVRNKGKKETLGDFLKEAMEATNFSKEDVAAAIGKDVSFIEQILKNSPTLSNLDPDNTADLISLLSIHISVLKEMFPKELDIPPMRIGGREGSSGLEGVIGFRTAPSMKLKESDARWLASVRRALQHLNRNDLID